MSLVSTYVQSREGNWYNTPTIRGKDGSWYICYDDDDPIELVIRVKDGPSAHGIISALRGQGWSLAIMYKAHEGAQRCFGKNFDSFAPAVSYFLRQVSGAPSDEMLKGNDRLPKKPNGQGVYYFNK